MASPSYSGSTGDLNIRDMLYTIDAYPVVDAVFIVKELNGNGSLVISGDGIEHQ